MLTTSVPAVMREWAIFAIRNCTENNAANQEIIRGLEARGVADQQSLRELGLDGEVGEDGRLRVRQRPQ